MKKSNVALLASVLIFLSVGCGKNYSTGERVGIVTKLSQKGVFIKSWEGEMLEALPVEVAGTTQPEKFYFAVANEAVEKVKAAMKSGKRVELVYRQWLLAPLSIGHKHVVVDVRESQK